MFSYIIAQPGPRQDLLGVVQSCLLSCGCIGGWYLTRKIDWNPALTDLTWLRQQYLTSDWARGEKTKDSISIKRWRFLCSCWTSSSCRLWWIITFLQVKWKSSSANWMQASSLLNLCPIWRRHFKTMLSTEYTGICRLFLSEMSSGWRKLLMITSKIHQKVKS